MPFRPVRTRPVMVSVFMVLTGVYLSFCEKYGKIKNNGAEGLAIANEFKTGVLLDVL